MIVRNDNYFHNIISILLIFLQTWLDWLRKSDTYSAPCERTSPYPLQNPESFEHLPLPINNNSHVGILQKIFVSPKSNIRQSLASTEVGELGLKSDKVSLDAESGQIAPRKRGGYVRDSKFTRDQNRLVETWLTSVTMIQEEIVDEIRPVGSPDGYSGDNLQVKGLSFSANDLQPGDLIAIGDQVKLLFTGYPHHACNRFGNRFGKEIQNTINTKAHCDERTRGLKLAVIKSGIIKNGDDVRIISRENQPDLWTRNIANETIQPEFFKRYQSLGLDESASCEEIIDFLVKEGIEADRVESRLSHRI